MAFDISDIVRRTAVLPVLLAVLLLGACGEEDAGARWDMSLPWSVKEFHTRNAIAFADRVAAETAGALVITVHPGAMLGLKGPESMRALEEGIVDMAEAPAFQQVGAEPLLGLESLPFLVADQAELSALYKVLRPRMEEIYARRGLKILYVVPWPNQNIYVKQRVTGLEDLRGVKIRTYDRGTSELMQRLGLSPVQMPSGDVVAALASGVIDAVMTSTTTGAAQKYWEFMSYLYRTNHVWISNIMAVNLQAWRALPPAIQSLVERIAKEMEPQFWAVSAADDQTQLALLQANGMTAIAPPREMAAQMRALARPMWAEFAARTGPEARAILDEFLAATGKDPLE